MSEPLTTYSATIRGNPGAASVNGWKKPVRRGNKASMALTPKYRAWRDGAVPVLRGYARGRSFGPGPLLVTIRTFWPRVTQTGPAKGLAFGDVDAVAKAVLDALESAVVFVNDAQVVELRLTKAACKDPRIEVDVKVPEVWA